jgi:hypothetical protein
MHAHDRVDQDSYELGSLSGQMSVDDADSHVDGEGGHSPRSVREELEEIDPHGGATRSEYGEYIDGSNGF